MYENATTLRVQPGKVDEVLCMLRAEFVPSLKGRAGFINLALFPDHTRSRITVISLWQSSTPARACEATDKCRRLMQDLEGLIDPLASSPPAPLRGASIS